jgi:hypothetical protein
MNEPAVVVSSPEREKALAYLADYLQGSPLVEGLGTAALSSECGGITLVTASEPPPGQDFSSGWGGKRTPCEQWLVTEIIRYLRDTPKSLVLLEDIVSSPSDPNLTAREHPPFWCYNNTVYWPISQAGADPHTVEQAMAWAVARRELVAFTKLPIDLPAPSGALSLSGEVFRQIVSSITRLVTDVFDWEGYMVWQRRD